MTKIFYTTEKIPASEFLQDVLRTSLGITAPLSKSDAGKPYLPGGEAFFSASDSTGMTAAAFSDRPIGFDIECTEKQREYSAIYRRMTEAERREIHSLEDFLAHWTAWESYVKLLGSTLSRHFRHLEFSGGVLRRDGVILPVTVTQGSILGGRYVWSLCQSRSPENPSGPDGECPQIIPIAP